MFKPVRTLAVLAVVCGLCAGPAAAASPGFVLPPELAAGEHAATVQLLEQAQALLPPAWAGALQRPLAFSWRDDLPEGVHGRARGGAIALRRELLDAWMQRDASAGLDDPRARRPLAAAIHELAHLYDLGRAGRLSADPRLLDLAGWQLAALRPGRRARNDMRDRSPDHYELHSPREYVAVNLEHYLLDPDYACRRPQLAAYFDAHFGRQSPGPAAGCAPGLAFVRDAIGHEQAWRELDPRRIHRVDYLLAEGNQQWASRFGHSMLRLVLCAPGRAPGEDCLLDVEHHLVLSFRAYVDDVQLSSWGGLSGAYPSRLFVLPLAQVIDEYTRVELRSLQSVPLRLSAGQRRALLTRALEQHWSYDGRYFFISNNCAVETLKLLRSGTADPRLADLDSLLPNGLLQLLVARGLADPSALAEPREAERLGYRFASYRERYTQLFAGLQADWGLPYGQVEDWLDAPPTQRQAWFARASLRQSAALLVLEQAARRRLLLRVQDELKQRYLSESPEALAPLGEGLQRLLQQSGFLSRPAELLGTQGYGLPQDEEWQRLAEHSAQRQAQLQQLAGQLDAALLQLLDPAQRAELAAQDANLRELSAQLRRLQRGAGGLRL